MAKDIVKLTGDIKLDESYKLVISDPNRFSRVRNYDDYIQELINFYFPYENSLNVLRQIVYKFIELKTFTIDEVSQSKETTVKDELENEINELMSEPCNILSNIDTKLNKVLLTKRFLLCSAGASEEVLNKFDRGVEILMRKIILMKKLFMAIYSISSVSLKTKKG